MKDEYFTEYLSVEDIADTNGFGMDSLESKGFWLMSSIENENVAQLLRVADVFKRKSNWNVGEIRLVGGEITVEFRYTK